MIIDRKSCVNIASTIFIMKLNMNTIKYHKPYRLQWLKKYGEIKVTKLVLVSFFIRKYSDEVLYDVVSKHTSHLLLGFLWQFDRKIIYDGFRNRYTLVKDKNFITLISLLSKHIYKNQLKLKGKKKVEGSENTRETVSLEKTMGAI